ncbi:hypothetical protein DH2020_017806 [Rehmannia glutinosa]|uniref:Transferring glycosyl group transferase n=1 Tax=Rehmannia glutinosa TaxID=99300 RepID=A0ABR0WKK8_REHGL
MAPPSPTSIQNLTKFWRQISVFSPNFTKALLTTSVFALFSLCFFLTFPYSKWRFNCPECDQTLIRDLINGPRLEQKTNISHILFGIGGSAKTWSQRRHYSELWWKPNITRGFVWLDENPARLEPWPKNSPQFKISADTARFNYTCWYGSRSAVRIARILKESFELGLENVRWFVMGDDDTVFFTENLVNVLRKYDYRKMYYIGSNSESVAQDLVHSYTMGYGGAGFAISYPLAAELVRVLDGCIDRYSDFYGSDQKIGGCMSEIGVPLTNELGFHQMDIRGSPYGLLSAHPLAPLVSLHHLDYVEPLFPHTNRVASVKKLINAYKSDPIRTLQQTFCYDLTRNWSISVSWGYTVQLYPFLVRAKDLNTPLQTFLTWTWTEGPFTFNTRKSSLKPCQRPVRFYFDGVKELGNQSTLTWYARQRDEHKRKCDRGNYKAAYLIKGFNVSAGFLDPQLWNEKQAPRRQCCEITGGSDQQDDIVQVRIRGCKQWESVTPP